MSKNKVEIDVQIDDKGTLGKVGLGAKKAAGELDGAGKSSDNYSKKAKGAAGATSNGTKAFSKMQQGMGGLVGAYATFAASVFALSAAFNFLKNASDVQVLEKSQIQFAQNSGIAMQSLTNKLRKASKGMLDFQAAAAASAMGLAKGFSSDQMTAMADGALKVSNVLGRNFTDSFDRLTRGVSKAEPELLDELGITLRLEDAKKKYALSLGIAADALTSADQSQAVYLETMVQLNKVVGETEGQANPFIQLGATFSDLAKTLSNVILPPFKALAGFLNENATVAALFFGAIGVGIAKNMPFVDSAKTAITSFFTGQITKAAAAQTALDKYNAELKETKVLASDLRKEGAVEIKAGAATAVKAGSKSPVLARASSGTMKGADITNLKKALKAAEADFLKTGKVTKGIFKEVGIDIARSIGDGLLKAETKAQVTTTKFKSFFRKTNLNAKLLGSTIKKKVAGAFIFAGKAAKFMGKAMSKAMKVTAILGVIQVIYDMIMSIVNAPQSILDGLVSVVRGFLSFIEVIVNAAIKAVNYVKKQVNKIPLFKDFEMTAKVDFAKGAGDKVANFVADTSLYSWAKGREADAKAEERFAEVLENTRSTAASLRKELELITGGRVMNKVLESGKANDDYDPLKADRAKGNAIQSLPVLDMLRELDKIKTTAPAKYAEGLASIKKEMKGLSKLSPIFADAVNSGVVSAVETLTHEASSFTANIDGAKDQLSNITTALKGASSQAVLSYTKNIAAMGKRAVAAGKSLGLVTDILQTLDERFSRAGGIDKFISNLQKIETEEKRIAKGKTAITIASMKAGSVLNSQFAAREQKKLAVQAAGLELSQKKNDLERMRSDDTLIMDEIQRASHKIAMEEGQREIALAVQKKDSAKLAANEIHQMGLEIGDSLMTNMATAFNALITGTMTAKQAFGSMAKSILSDIASMISRLLVMRLLQGAIGGLGMGPDTSSVSSGLSNISQGIGNNLDIATSSSITAMGSQIPKLATGGVAKGATKGFPAILHGTEAVVPLPNGRSIPVEMKNSGGGTNNIVVNVSSEGQTTTEGSSGGDMEGLGKAIAHAVQQELHTQKRSGGILNPYGAA